MQNKLKYQVLELFPTPVYTTGMPPELANVIPFLDAQAPNSGSDEANYGERSDNSYIFTPAIVYFLIKLIMPFLPS